MKNHLISSDNFSTTAKTTTYLLPGLWRENTTALLHGSRETDKTEKAIEIARSISGASRKLVYINAADTLHDHASKLSGISNLSILTPAFDSCDDPTDYADLVISAIEEIIAETDIRVFIIDSVTRIAALSYGRNSSAAFVMKRLVNLQMRSGCSFLVLSNDSTKSADRSLLNLVSSEIKATDSDTSDNSDRSDNTTALDSPQHPDTPRPAPIAAGKLSRKDRRILRRQAKKDAKPICKMTI